MIATTILAKLKEPTRGTYRVHDWLMGPHMAKLRQEIMADLTCQKLPQSKCGITALVKLLYSLAGVGTGCGAVNEDKFAMYAAEQLGDVEYIERVDRERREYEEKYGALA